MLQIYFLDCLSTAVVDYIGGGKVIEFKVRASVFLKAIGFEKIAFRSSSLSSLSLEEVSEGKSSNFFSSLSLSAINR